MELCLIDWNIIGTWALVGATLWVAWLTRNLVREQRAATTEQREIARAELAEQQKIAKTQLAVRIHMDMEERFDRPLILMERARLARLMIENAPRDLITEGVPEFFESLAILDRLDYLVPELTYNGSAFM
jgi:hypothetical protein